MMIAKRNYKQSLPFVQDQSMVRFVDCCTATELTILGVVLLHLLIVCSTFSTWEKEGNGRGFTTFKAPPLGHDFNHQLTTDRQKK